jgi:hypothetical protein
MNYAVMKGENPGESTLHFVYPHELWKCVIRIMSKSLAS